MRVYFSGSVRRGRRGTACIEESGIGRDGEGGPSGFHDAAGMGRLVVELRHAGRFKVAMRA
jgi:hypothetical protein